MEHALRLTPGADVQGKLRLEVLDARTLSVLASGQAAAGSRGEGIDLAGTAVKKGQAVLLHVLGTTTTTQGGFTLEFTNLDQFTMPENRTLLFPAGAGPSEVASDDLNHDGKLDLVVSDAFSNTVSVLLANGDGTFQAPRQYAAGAFATPKGDLERSLPAFGRAVAIADLNGDGNPDLIVTNDASSDISVLLGRRDGTFEPQRRFDATAAPHALAVGDFNNDGLPDLAVTDLTANPVIHVAILLGHLPPPHPSGQIERDQWTFQPGHPFQVPAADPFTQSGVQSADLNHDDKTDLIISGNDDPTKEVAIFLGHGDGTFTHKTDLVSVRQGFVSAVTDVNGDGNPDLLVTGIGEQNQVAVHLGKGDGTFEDAQYFPAGQAPTVLGIADLGSQLPDGSLGPPDGHRDLIVADSGVARGVPATGGPGVVILPRLPDTDEKFAGFGPPIALASATAPQSLAVRDVNGDGFPDVAVVELDGVQVIYGQPLTREPHNTPQAARNLGTVVHVLEPTLTIVPGHLDAYFTLTVPTEAAPGAGDEVLDFSGLFQATEGAGLSMEVRDAADNLLGAGERFRVHAPQGAALTLHVFGLGGAGDRPGAGAYTLDIATLPQVSSVEAQALLPGRGSAPGGPTASLVLTFQGDRLDPATAQTPANYTVTWLGPDSVPDTADDQVIPVAATQAVYDPSSNVDVASGKTYPTAVRQTITLVFDRPLPPGSYRIELSPAIQTATFNDQEPELLFRSAGFTGHPVVALNSEQSSEGSRRLAADLVLGSGLLGDLGVWQAGTPFLTQLHDDLGALLDDALTRLGDDPAISESLNRQILDRLAPALGPAAARPVAVLVIWLDPPSIALLDPQGQRAVYNLHDSSFRNDFRTGFVSVAGNVEVLVLPFSASVAEVYRLSVADVPPNARGGAVYLGREGTQTLLLTLDLRWGTAEFVFSFGGGGFQPRPSPPSPVVAAQRAAGADRPAPATLVVTTPVASAPSATGADVPVGTVTLSPAAALVSLPPGQEAGTPTSIAPRLDSGTGLPPSQTALPVVTPVSNPLPGSGDSGDPAAPPASPLQDGLDRLFTGLSEWIGAAQEAIEVGFARRLQVEGADWAHAVLRAVEGWFRGKRSQPAPAEREEGKLEVPPEGSGEDADAAWLPAPGSAGGLVEGSEGAVEGALATLVGLAGICQGRSHSRDPAAPSRPRLPGTGPARGESNQRRRFEERTDA